MYPVDWKPDNTYRPASKPAKEYPFTLDPFQKQAIQYIERNESVLVSAHTSAGKVCFCALSKRPGCILYRTWVAYLLQEAEDAMCILYEPSSLYQVFRRVYLVRCKMPARLRTLRSRLAALNHRSLPYILAHDQHCTCWGTSPFLEGGDGSTVCVSSPCLCVAFLRFVPS